MTTVTNNEFGILWFDADIFKADKGIVLNMVTNGKEKPIITASCRLGNNQDYDLNAWKGNRTRPSPAELSSLDTGGFYEPRDVKGEMYHLKHLRDQSTFMELDSVGGTILFLRSFVIKQGVIFPPLYIIGTDWDRIQGYDGIETEGICYIANSIGYK